MAEEQAHRALPARMRLLSRVRLSGYQKPDFLTSFLFNFSASLVMLLLALPFFIFIPILIKLQDGGPVFYRGERLGFRKKIFFMYKFRTLVPNAEQLIGAKLLSATRKTALVTPLGHFLRDTRLDELPQLINVLKGEMDLIGPRPERPAVYEQTCRFIPGYEKRFDVNPGVIGHSQLFTPHGTPKRIRVLIDNFYVSRKQQIGSDGLFFVYAMYLLCKKALFRTIRVSRNLREQVLRRRALTNQRQSERITHKGSHIHFRFESEEESVKERLGTLEDINDEALILRFPTELPLEDSLQLRLVRQLNNPVVGTRKRKICRANGHIVAIKPSPTHPGHFHHVVFYEAASPLNEYKIYKYFLYQSIS